MDSKIGNQIFIFKISKFEIKKGIQHCEQLYQGVVINIQFMPWIIATVHALQYLNADYHNTSTGKFRY